MMAICCSRSSGACPQVESTLSTSRKAEAISITMNCFCAGCGHGQQRRGEPDHSGGRQEFPSSAFHRCFPFKK